MTLSANSRDLQALRTALLEHASVGQLRQPVTGLSALMTPDFLSDKRLGSNLTIRLHGRNVAYIHNWSLSADETCAQVCHFALDTAWTRHGYGRAVAERFAAALRHAFSSVVTIDFWQQSGDPIAYEKFFRKLGATDQADELYRQRRPHWFWTIPPDLPAPARRTAGWWARLRRSVTSSAPNYLTYQRSRRCVGFGQTILLTGAHLADQAR